jgi:hypothetical protein
MKMNMTLLLALGFLSALVPLPARQVAHAQGNNPKNFVPRAVFQAAGLTAGSPVGGAQGGLAALFNNPTYGVTFGTFSPLRLFTPVGSNITSNPHRPPDVPIANASLPATSYVNQAACPGYPPNCLD